MNAISKKLYLFLVLLFVMLVSCGDDKPNDPTNNDTSNPTFDWIQEFNFDEDHNYENDDVFIFDNGENYYALPVYLFNALLLNSYDEPVLTDRSAVFNDDGTFAIQRTWDMGNDNVTYDNRHGLIDISGKFGSNNIFEYITIAFTYDAFSNREGMIGPLNETFSIHLTDLPFEKIGDILYISVDEGYLESHITDLEYTSSFPTPDGIKDRNLESINWTQANNVGLHLEIEFSTKAD